MQKTDNEPSSVQFVKALYSKFLQFIDKAKMTEHTFVILVAILIGLLGGYGAVLIQFSIKWFQRLFWQGSFNLETIGSVPWYMKVMIPTIGGAIVGLVITLFVSLIPNTGGLIGVNMWGMPFPWISQVVYPGALPQINLPILFADFMLWWFIVYLGFYSLIKLGIVL